MLCMTNFARAQVRRGRAGSDRGPGRIGRRQVARHPRLRQLQPLRLRARIHLLDAGDRLPLRPRAGESARTSPGAAGEYGTVRSIFRAWMRSPGAPRQHPRRVQPRSASTSRRAPSTAPAGPASGPSTSAPTANSGPRRAGRAPGSDRAQASDDAVGPLAEVAQRGSS